MWSPPLGCTLACQRTPPKEGTRRAMSTRRSSAYIGSRATSVTSRTSSSPSWTSTRLNMRDGRRRTSGPPLVSSGAPTPSGARLSCSPTTDARSGTTTGSPVRLREQWQSQGRPRSHPLDTPSSSPSGRADIRGPGPRGSRGPRPRLRVRPPVEGPRRTAKRDRRGRAPGTVAAQAASAGPPRGLPRKDHVVTGAPGRAGQLFRTGCRAASEPSPQHGSSHAHAHGPHRQAPHLLQ